MTKEYPHSTTPCIPLLLPTPPPLELNPDAPDNVVDADVDDVNNDADDDFYDDADDDFYDDADDKKMRSPKIA